MPSSLTGVLSSTSVYSTSPPVSVCGTGAHSLARGFSRRYGLNPYGSGLPPALTLPSQVSIGPDLPGPTPYRVGGAYRARDLAPRVPPSLHPTRRPETRLRGTGILTRCPSPTAQALGLGPPHPQLISMAAEPSGIRWGGFAPPSRYSCRHSHSSALHQASRPDFTAHTTLPYPSTLLNHEGLENM